MRMLSCSSKGMSSSFSSYELNSSILSSSSITDCTRFTCGRVRVRVRVRVKLIVRRRVEPSAYCKLVGCPLSHNPRGGHSQTAIDIAFVSNG